MWPCRITYACRHICSNTLKLCLLDSIPRTRIGVLPLRRMSTSNGADELLRRSNAGGYPFWGIPAPVAERNTCVKRGGVLHTRCRVKSRSIFHMVQARDMEVGDFGREDASSKMPRLQKYRVHTITRSKCAPTNIGFPTHTTPVLHTRAPAYMQSLATA